MPRYSVQQVIVGACWESPVLADKPCGEITRAVFLVPLSGRLYDQIRASTPQRLRLVLLFVTDRPKGKQVGAK
jgi:hypothetical protein